MAKVFCPFCLTIHDFGEPPTCTKRPGNPDVPRSYIQGYDRSQPLWLAAIGFPGHGKTTFIGGLSLVLDYADKFWEDSAVDYLDQYTYGEIQKAREIFQEGKVYKPTQKESADDMKRSEESKRETVTRPLLIRTNAIPPFQSRCLVIYDTAGEYFKTLTGIPEEASQTGYLKSLKAVKNIWFMISLPDLAGLTDPTAQPDARHQSLKDLLNIYTSGMERMGWDIRGNNLIVVYSKADLLRNIESIPSSIREYLESDQYGPLASSLKSAGQSDFFHGAERIKFDMKDYLAKMEEISNELREYTKKLAGGEAFLSLANYHGLNVYFTITSALGTNPQTDADMQRKEGITPYKSYRVLDPLLWALRLGPTPPMPTTLKLILDMNPIDAEGGGGGKNILVDSSSANNDTNSTTPEEDEAMNTGTVINHSSNPIYSLPLEKLVEELGKVGDEIITYYLGRNKACALPGQNPPLAPPKQRYARLLRPLLVEGESNTLALVLTNGPINDLDDLLYSEPEVGQDWSNRLFIVSLSNDYEPNWKSSLNFRAGGSISLIINQFKRMLQESKPEGV